MPIAWRLARCRESSRKVIDVGVEGVVGVVDEREAGNGKTTLLSYAQQRAHKLGVGSCQRVRRAKSPSWRTPLFATPSSSIASSVSGPGPNSDVEWVNRQVR